MVAGRLGNCLPFWESIGASQFILDILSNGYFLPLTSHPKDRQFPNHRSAYEEEEFVSESLASLLSRGCIRKVGENEIVVCSPLGVVSNGQKLRLILDLRYVNKHLSKFKFKLEDMRTVTQVYRKGDYLVTFDLKSGYHHVLMAREHWRYLGFMWKDTEGRKQYYVFCVLPFGLATAPYIFTKITRVLLSSWRASGIRCQLYMDDGSGGDETLAGAKRVARKVAGGFTEGWFHGTSYEMLLGPISACSNAGHGVGSESGLGYG